MTAWWAASSTTTGSGNGGNRPRECRPVIRRRAGGGRPSPSAGNSLSTYLDGIATQPVLDADQEVRLARGIQQLEESEWVQLLTHPPSLAPQLDALRRALHPRIPAPLKALDRFVRPGEGRTAAGRRRRETAWAEAAARAAAALRLRDTDRLLLDAAIDRVLDPDGTARTPVRSAAAIGPWARFRRRVRQAAAESARAKERFILANLRLVVAVARRYRYLGAPLLDLIQEGNLGLLKAVERFDPSRGFRFSTYASWWIRQSVVRGLGRQDRTVRLPGTARIRARRVDRVATGLAARTGRTPSDREVADQLGMREEKVHAIRAESIGPAVSLDQPIGHDDDDRRFVDLLPAANHDPLEEVLRDERGQEVVRMLECLRPFEAEVVRRRFGFIDGEETTLQEIGERHHLTRERIRQIEARALARLRRLADGLR